MKITNGFKLLLCIIIMTLSSNVYAQQKKEELANRRSTRLGPIAQLEVPQAGEILEITINMKESVEEYTLIMVEGDQDKIDFISVHLGDHRMKAVTDRVAHGTVKTIESRDGKKSIGSLLWFPPLTSALNKRSYYHFDLMPDNSIRIGANEQQEGHAISGTWKFLE